MLLLAGVAARRRLRADARIVEATPGRRGYTPSGQSTGTVATTIRRCTLLAHCSVDGFAAMAHAKNRQ